MKKVLYAIYLKHDSASQSLEISALTQLIIKVLYSIKKPVNISLISKYIQDIIGVRVNNEKIIRSLQEIKSRLSISNHKKLYKLRDNYRNKLDSIYIERDRRFNRVIDKYFNGAETDIEKIKKWFDDASIAYFCEFSSEWINGISTVGYRFNDKIQLEEVFKAKKIFKLNGIVRKDEKWLTEQYKKFLSSIDPDEVALLWDYGNSLFSSQIITSNEFIDKSITDMFKDSNIIFDTNILMRIGLEKDVYSESYSAIEIIFKKLNIKPIYFNITKKEYRIAISHKIEEIKAVREKYNYKVYSKSDDVFIQTALHRNCTEDEHYETFFRDIQEIPEKISSDLLIEERDYRELSEEIILGEESPIIKNSINEIYKSKTKRDKKEASLRHDAGLVNGANFLRKEVPSWILSRDSTIIQYAKNNEIRDDMPICISIDSLINLLAINDGFEGISESSFIPLFCNLVRTSVYPVDQVFQIEDLLYMKDIESQIADLPEEKIILIANEVNRNRIKGYDTNKIALQLERDFQKAKLEIATELEDTTNRLINKNVENERISNNYSKAKKGFFRKTEMDLGKIYRKKYIKDIILFFTLCPISITILLYILYRVFPLNSLNNAVSIIISLSTGLLVTLFTSKFFVLPRIIKKYNNKKSEMNKCIEDMWNDFLSNEE